MSRPKFGAMRRRGCGCASQYGLWAGGAGSWSLVIMCDGHATPEYRARIAEEGGQEAATWRYYHGTGQAFAPGDELDDTHGSGLWLNTSQAAASHYARLNAMGRREYFGDAEARPHVYEVEPDGLEGAETGFRAKRATILREVEYAPPYRAESWEDYAASTPPAVLDGAGAL